MKKYIIFTSFLLISYFGGVNQGFAQGSNNSSSPRTTVITDTTTSSTNNTTNNGYDNISDIPGFEIPGLESYNEMFGNNNVDESFDTPYENKAQQIESEKIVAAQVEKKAFTDAITEATSAVKSAEASVKSAQKALDDAKTPEAKAIAEKSLTEAKNAQKDAENAKESANKAEQTRLDNIDAAQKKLDNLGSVGSPEAIAEAKKELELAKNTSASEIAAAEAKAASNAAEKGSKSAHEAECANSKNCLDQPTFSIGVNDLIGVGFQKKAGDDTSNTINRTLGTIIQKLMVALGVLSVLIMTVGAGYIIMYHGQDELLSKGKSIFMSGVTALIVALSSYYIVSILRFILYN